MTTALAQAMASKLQAPPRLPGPEDATAPPPPGPGGTTSSQSSGLYGPLAYGGKDPTLSPYLEAPGEHEMRLGEALGGVRQAQDLQSERYSEEAARAGLTPGSGAAQSVLAGLMRQTGQAESGIRKADFLAGEDSRRRREELLSQMQAELERTRVGSAASLQGSMYGADKGLEGTKYASDRGLEGTKYSANSSAGASKYAANAAAGASRYATGRQYDISNRGMLLDEQRAPFDLARLMMDPYAVNFPTVGSQAQGPSTMNRIASGLGGGAEGYATYLGSKK